jgi:integrase/recombinase XerD
VNLNDLIIRYVAFRRALGQKCKNNAAILSSFSRAIGPLTPVSRIRIRAVIAFLNHSTMRARNWHTKYYALKGFFRFAVSRGHLDKAPLPTDLPKAAPPFVAYIYSHEELRRLLDAVRSYRRYRIESNTLRAIVLLLYGAGLRLGEALRLSREDVDLENALLTIRDTKFYKSRLVPIGRNLKDVLTEYARWKAVTHAAAGPGCRFFVSKRGTTIPLRTMQGAFEWLREHAGLHRSDGGRFQPRLHDLRHTFAVHRLTTWYCQGADVQRLLHHLSVYLGHAHLAATQVYLTMTPELLDQASARFERYARGENCHV